jgi:hypothetical protein
MARVDMDEFGDGTEIVRVYLAASLAEAQAIEGSLDGAGLEYAVEVERLADRTLLSASRSGAGFWVRADRLDAAADLLERAGHLRGLVQR